MRRIQDTMAVLAILCTFTLTAAQPARAAVARHTLWKVEGKKHAVYLLGSVHVLKATDYPLASPIEAAFSNAAIVAFETDLAAMESPAMAAKLMLKGQLPPGETLRKQLSPAVYLMWSNHITEAGLPVELFEQFTPAMAGLTIAMLEIQRMGLNPEHGVDKHFFTRARAAGKEIVPLETVEFQIELLTDFTKQDGELLLQSTLKDMKKMKGEVEGIIQAWKTGDAARLEQLLNDAMKESPSIYKRMLTDRNRNWLPKIEELVRGNRNALVIVGAGHLVGKDGVVQLLRGKGFKVTQE